MALKSQNSPADNHSMPSESFFIASMLWSTIGVAFIVWGRKMGETAPVAAGVALIVISWLIDSAVSMTLTAIAIMVVMRYAMRRGF